MAARREFHVGKIDAQRVCDEIARCKFPREIFELRFQTRIAAQVGARYIQ
jgi:hypothetical protein